MKSSERIVQKNAFNTTIILINNDLVAEDLFYDITHNLKLLFTSKNSGYLNSNILINSAN